MQEKSIINALLHIRVETLQAGQDACHVNALLVSRGYDLASHHVPHKIPDDSFKRMTLQRLIMDALAGGPLTGPEIACYVMTECPHIDYDTAYKRVYRGLARLKRSGLVGREKIFWHAVW